MKYSFLFFFAISICIFGFSKGRKVEQFYGNNELCYVDEIKDDIRKTVAIPLQIYNETCCYVEISELKNDSVLANVTWDSQQLPNFSIQGVHYKKTNDWAAGKTIYMKTCISCVDADSTETYVRFHFEKSKLVMSFIGNSFDTTIVNANGYASIDECKNSPDNTCVPVLPFSMFYKEN